MTEEDVRCRDADPVEYTRCDRVPALLSWLIIIISAKYYSYLGN